MSFRKIQTTNLKSVETSFSDPVIVIGKDNTSPSDIGFLGKMSVNTYSGLIRDAETQKYYLIENYISTNTNNNINPVSASKGTLVVGTLEADKITVPSGTTMQRPSSPVEGQLFFNSTTKMFEGYNGTTWIQLVPASAQDYPQ